MNLLDDKLQEILNNADYDCSILNVNIDKNIQDNLLGLSNFYMFKI